MQIELIYSAPKDRKFDEKTRRKWLELDDGSDIKDILPRLYGSGLAKWQDDKYGGMVVSEYEDSGKCEDNTSYLILSTNIPKTITALDSL
jgi:hypothetical protein